MEVVYLTALVVESLTDGDVRRELLRQFLDEADIQDSRTREAVEEYLSAMPDQEMVPAMMAGVRKSQLRTGSARLGDYLSAAGDDYPFAVDPLPNLYFTRDPFATIGTGAVLSGVNWVAVASASLLVSSDMFSFVDSMAAPLSLLNALILAVGQQRRDDLSATLADMEQVWSRYSIFGKDDE